MKSLYPIALFVYNRPIHTLNTLNSLVKNKLARYSELYIYSDGPKNEEDEESVTKVREVIKTFKEFKKISIEESPINRGLAESIISGLSGLFESFEGVIILEDDILVTEFFLQFMNDSMRAYSSDNRIAGVTAYSYPFKKKSSIPDFYFLPIGSSWGWGTWKRVWDNINLNSRSLISEIDDLKKVDEFNFGDHNFYEMLRKQEAGEIDSWAIRFYASFFLRNQIFLFPKYSMLKNIGFDGSGLHNTLADEFYNTDYRHQKFKKIETKLIPEVVNKAMRLNKTRFRVSSILKFFK